MASTMDWLGSTGEMAEGAKDESLNAWKEFIGDFMSEGILVNAFNTVKGNQSKYDAGQPVTATLGSMAVDLGASRIAPVPIMGAIRDLVDPEMRRLNDSKTLGYNPGLIEGVASKLPFLSKKLPPKGEVKTENLGNAASELARLGDNPAASKLWQETKPDSEGVMKTTTKATYVDPNDKRDIPRWRTAMRLVGQNIKPVNREGYKAAVSGKEQAAIYRKAMRKLNQ